MHDGAGAAGHIEQARSFLETDVIEPFGPELAHPRVVDFVTA